ncbi:MAG: aspartate kinase [bacterium]
MRIVVLKFGGKLLDSPAKIRRSAHFILAQRAQGRSPVVVASAPGRVTDYFRRLASRVANNPDQRELDMLLSVGERLGISLLAMAINDLDPHRAISFTGSQVGIITDTRHTEARILEIKPSRLLQALERDRIPIIAGFQGVSVLREITTLGRGGSDYTAVALASALNASECLLVKEMGGIYTADPLLVPEAQVHTLIDFTTLEEFSTLGARVVQDRAASLARQSQVPLILTDLNGDKTTRVVDRRLSAGPIAGIVLHQGLQYRFQPNAPNSADPQPLWELGIKDQGKTLLTGKFSPLREGETVDLVSIVGWGGTLEDEVLEVADQFFQSHTEAVVASWKERGSAHWALPAGEGKKLLPSLHAWVKDKGVLKPASEEHNPPILSPEERRNEQEGCL